PALLVLLPSLRPFPYTTLFRSLVEVSTDGGSTWNAATPLKAPVSGLTWSLWKYTPTGPLSGGSHRIVARAYDGTGLIQDSVPEPDRKSTRLNSSHQIISYAVFC